MEKMSFIPEENNMEKVKYHGVAMGGKIYSLRMAKRMSQEQLAAVLSISPAAVCRFLAFAIPYRTHRLCVM